MSEYRKPMRAPAARRGWRLLTVGVVGGVIAAGMITGTGSSAASAPPFNAHLTRAPYLTDLVGLQVAINFATDRSASSASVSYGPESDGGCALTSAFAPTRTPIMVGTVAEYQWTAALTLPAAGRYCYRVYLAGADLLAGAPSPSFATQVLPGDPTPVIFDVLGDWGQVGTDGTNPDQANLMEQIASSGARFAVTVGDNGYPNGSQINYGDLQQVGANTSAIFGPDFWTVPGSSVPLFVVAGNHGETGTQHTDLTTWTQHAAVTESAGRYQNDLYCCVLGTTQQNYASDWYAFTAGHARFYILDAAWGDTNPGTDGIYAADAAAHFAPGDPEYQWLLADLDAHPTQLKFAFFHFPLYADNPQDGTDTYLDGPANLEGVLADHDVQIVFNGHAHLYQRNIPSGPGMPISYVTGGGGGTLEPVGPCTSLDAYGIGWSPRKQTGSACGAATRPVAAAQVYHFLRVTVAGSTVTVEPTDSRGDTFDVQSYTFNVPTDTYLDSGPPDITSSSTATFTFHSTSEAAQYTCSLDAGPATACESPVTYQNLVGGPHHFEVAATDSDLTDATPAQQDWTVDDAAPTAPANPEVAAASPSEIDLSWDAATDDTAVTGYRIYRDATLYRTVADVTSYADPVLAGSTHQYFVTAMDAVGHESPPSATVSAGASPAPVFADGFESGTLAAWTSTHGLAVQGGAAGDGSYAAQADTTDGNTYAKRTLPAGYPEGYARVMVHVIAQASQLNLLRLRSPSGSSLCFLYLTTSGRLSLHDDATGTNTTSSTTLTPGWHAIELHLKADAASGGATGVLQVWLDDAPVADLSSTAVDVGTAPIGQLQIGEVQAGRSYTVAFDDVAFDTARLGRQ